MKNKLSMIKDYLSVVMIILTIISLVFLVYALNKCASSINIITPPNIESKEYMAFASNFINTAALLIGIFGIIIMAVGIFSYVESHRISEIRKQAETILNEKKNELIEKNLSDLAETLSGFMKSVITFNDNFIVFLEQSFPRNKHIAELKDSIDAHKDIIESIRSLKSDDPTTAQKAIFAIKVFGISEFAIFLDMFIKMREKKSEFKSDIIAAKEVKKYLERIG